MKGAFIIYLFFQATMAYSQQLELFIYDQATNLPIPDTYAYYVNDRNGNFTNNDGHTYLSYKPDSLIIQHLNYYQNKIKTNSTDDTIRLYLCPKENLLNEIMVSNYDILEILAFVQKNYQKLYINHPVNRECSYKEITKFDNQYQRLIQSQLNWWSKNSAYHPSKKMEKSCVITLGNIEFFRNKSISIEEFEGKGDSFVTKHGLIQSLYLNNILEILRNFRGNISQYVTGATENTITITYETDWRKFTNAEVQLKGHIVLDKKTKGILEFAINDNYKNAIKTDYTKDSIKYEVEVLKESQTLRFIKDQKGQLSFKYSSLNVNGVLRIPNKAHSFDIYNHFFVLSEKEQRNPPSGSSIDLNKPIYKSIATNTVNKSSVLLSKEEQEFINGK